ncbi:hypothetical protein Patl1_14413 [Pistacia atlantica]|uniref:Uncharacterized protein n=1 Tax=Pistacia atlantica TaxID=434234 RepID=A0ACC1ASU9_9ROSI|nr:hypothetical protein Patl1_14413 [Pistacia atlantica]
MKILMMVAMAMCLSSAAYAAQGTATYYTPPYNQSNASVPQTKACHNLALVPALSLKLLIYVHKDAEPPLISDLSQEAFAKIAKRERSRSSTLRFEVFSKTKKRSLKWKALVFIIYNKTVHISRKLVKD